MKKVARLSNEERQELFQATAIKMGMRPEVVEKDFWVCFMLDHLFHDCEYKDAFVFKGGTSLSKSYHVIERFSEDIDLTYASIPKTAKRKEIMHKVKNVIEQREDLELVNKENIWRNCICKIACA